MNNEREENGVKVTGAIVNSNERENVSAVNEFVNRYRNPIIGRENERQLLETALQQIGNETRSFALVGEPGIGKSRLAATITKAAQLSRIKIVAAFGGVLKRATPFSAIRLVILEALRERKITDENQIQEILREIKLHDADKKAVATILFPKNENDTIQTSGLTSTQIGRALISCLVEIVLPRPTFLLIEDLHLIDSESCDALRLISEEHANAPFFILITSRPESEHIARKIVKEIIPLQPMPKTAMTDLAKSLLTERDREFAQVERAIDRADGIPFVLEQILQSMEGAGEAAPDMLPQSVETVIRTRMERLSRKSYSFIQALSLLGEDVEIEIAKILFGSDSEEFVDCVDELERLGFLYPTTGVSLRFRHAILVEACAGTISSDDRKNLHGSAIRAISNHYSDLTGQFERLAFHAEGADEHLQALEYHWNAGRRAVKSAASKSLVQIFNRAIQAVKKIGHDGDKWLVDFVLMSFDMMQQQGETKKVGAFLPKTIDLARQQKRPDKVCMAMCHMTLACWLEARYEKGVEIGEDALKIAKATGALPLVFYSQFALSVNLHGMAELEKAINLQKELTEKLVGEAATARLGAAGIPGAISRSYVSYFMMDSGQYEEGLKYAEEGLAIAMDQRDPYSEVLARIALGRNLYSLKRNQEAAECLMIAKALCDQNGYDPAKPTVTGHLATALSRCGEAKKGVDVAEECFDGGYDLPMDRRPSLHFLNAGYAEALFRTGRIEDGLAAANRTIEISRENKEPCSIALALGLRSRMLAEVDSENALIKSDLQEQHDICTKHGIAVWR